MEHFYLFQGLKRMITSFHDFPVKQFEMLHCVKRLQVNKIDTSYISQRAPIGHTWPSGKNI